jgi:hypothetical protein
MSAVYTIKLEDLASGGLIQVADHADEVQSRLDNATGAVGRMNKQMGGTPGYIKAIGGAVAGYLTFQGITQLVSGVFTVGAEFERLEAVLTNMMGPEAAKKAFADIKEFAATTPFEVQGLTDSFVRLSNQGFVPTMAEMEKLGDLASAVGKPFDQLSEAILDAMTGENERLKEFGIKAKVNGDQTAFTFKGVTTTVNNTSEGIKDYILSLGDLQGVQGAMNAIMGTTGGRLSNLKDGITNLANEIFQSSNPAFDSMISVAQGLVAGIGDVIGFMREHTTLVKVLAGAVSAAALGYGIFTVASYVASGGMVILAKSVWASTYAFLASPLGWVTVGLAAVTGGVLYLWETFEGFRGFLYGLWDSIKIIFGGITDIFTEFFGGAYDLIVGLVSFDSDLVAAGIEKIGGALVKANPVGFVATYGEDIADGFSNGYDKGVQSFKADQAGGLGAFPIVNPSDPAGMPNKPGGAPSAPGATNLKAGIAAVEADAKQVRNLTINIENLISGGVNISTTKIDQAYGKVKEEVLNTLLGAVNDVNLAAP